MYVEILKAIFFINTLKLFYFYILDIAIETRHTQ